MRRECNRSGNNSNPDSTQQNGSGNVDKQNKRNLTRGLILLGSAAALAVSPIWMAAQQPPAGVPATTAATGPAPTVLSAVPIPGAQPTTLPATSAPVAATAPVVAVIRTNPPTTQIAMRFKDAPIDSVLSYLSQSAGYQVLKTASVDGNVTAWSEQPVTPEKAVELLNSMLKDKGYTAVVQGTVLKVMTIQQAQKSSIPVFFGEDPRAIPLTDTLVTQVIPLKTLDAIKLRQDLQPLVSSTTDLTANAASNSLMMTDTQANVHRVVEIVSNLDKRDQTENGIIVRQLKYADATATAKLITDIFKPADQSQQNGQNNPFGFFRGFGRGGGGGGPGGFGPGGGGPGGGDNSQDNEKGKTGTVVASADTRTNSIVVTGPQDTLAIITSEVLDKIDSDNSRDEKFFTYPVKNGQAVDMQNTLNTLFGATITSSGSNRGSSYNSQTGNRNATGFGSGSSGFGGGGGSRGGSGGLGGSSGFGGSTSSNRGSSGSNNNNNNNRGGGFGGFGGFGGGGGAGSAASGITADLVGQVEVVADSDTNSLLVLTASKYEDDVRQIIKDLDRPVPQVLIKVLIAEVTHDRSDDLGLDFSILNLSKGLTAGSNLGNIASATAGGGLAVNLVESQITTTLHALAVADKLDVLSRPYILTSDNQEANILVGQEVPFVTDTRTDSLGQQINTIQYQDIGIILDVTPHINPDGLVVMDINPQISSQAAQSVQIQAGLNAPVFNSRSASSHVGVQDGQTIVIGGLMQDQKNQTVTKVPVLGDIPWLGLLFQRDQVTKTKTELLIFLTPHVAAAPERLTPISTDEMRGIHLTPGAVQPGTFQEHMKGLQLGGSATQPVLPTPKPEFNRDWWEPEPKMP
jgi:general secretion pathway protein D